MSKTTETILVNLTDYKGGSRVQIHAEQSDTRPTLWEISISNLEGIWLADGKYVAEHGRGIEDCDAQFSELDYRLMDEALGLMVKELGGEQKDLEELWEGVKEDRKQEARLNENEGATRTYKITCAPETSAASLGDAYTATEGTWCNVGSQVWITVSSEVHDWDTLEADFEDDERIVEFEVI